MAKCAVGIAPKHSTQGRNLGIVACLWGHGCQRLIIMNRQELEKKVRHCVNVLVREKGYASPLDLFLRMEKITPKLVEEWRFRRVPYLERVIQGGLGRLNVILEVFHRTAKEMNLKPSTTVYMSYGKGKKIPLQFSKSGHPYFERRYSTHYVKPAVKEQKKDMTTAEQETPQPESVP